MRRRKPRKVIGNFITDASVMPPFKAGDDSAQAWNKWVKAFETFLRVNKITNDQEKYDMLTLIGGSELQDALDGITEHEVNSVATIGTAAKKLLYDTANCHSKRSLHRNLVNDMSDTN